MRLGHFHKSSATQALSSRSLLPPEAYVEAEWDKPTDIWTFGCLVRARRLMTRRWEFSDCHILQIFELVSLPLQEKCKILLGHDRERAWSGEGSVHVILSGSSTYPHVVENV